MFKKGIPAGWALVALIGIAGLICISLLTITVTLLGFSVNIGWLLLIIAGVATIALLVKRMIVGVITFAVILVIIFFLLNSGVGNAFGGF